MAKARTYLPEFRRQMVELVRTGRSPIELSREFGPTAQSIRAWVRAAEGRAEPRPGDLTEAEKDELQRLRRENQQLRVEREILAKAAAWFARETGIFYANGVKANVLFFDNREASPDPWTKEVWIYDYRTNVHHTLKKKPMRFEDLKDFITCYNPVNRHDRVESWEEASGPEGRSRRFTRDEIIARDKTSLDIFWLRDKSLADLDNLPEPDELADEMIENIEAGLESIRRILAAL